MRIHLFRRYACLHAYLCLGVCVCARSPPGPVARGPRLPPAVPAGAARRRCGARRGPAEAARGAVRLRGSGRLLRGPAEGAPRRLHSPSASAFQWLRFHGAAAADGPEGRCSQLVARAASTHWSTEAPWYARKRSFGGRGLSAEQAAKAASCSKAAWMRSWQPALGEPALARGLDDVVSKGPFQPHSVIL